MGAKTFNHKWRVAKEYYLNTLCNAIFPCLPVTWNTNQYMYAAIPSTTIFPMPPLDFKYLTPIFHKTPNF